MNANLQLQTGQIFARYQIVRTIGEGGMGTVYEALHPALKKRFAIKTLLPSIAQTPEFRARFLREAEVAARINHPNIVRVTDVGSDRDTPYMVMEYLGGGPSVVCWKAVAAWRSPRQRTFCCPSFRPLLPVTPKASFIAISSRRTFFSRRDRRAVLFPRCSTLVSRS